MGFSTVKFEHVHTCPQTVSMVLALFCAFTIFDNLLSCKGLVIEQNIPKFETQGYTYADMVYNVISGYTNLKYDPLLEPH